MSLVDLGKRLLEAAKRGDTDEVRQLMSNGAPFTTDWLGTSPLHFSAQFGHLSTAEVLLRAGISRDARTKVDRTPLHVAAQEGHVDIVDLLLQHAADIDAKDMLKMTPLHWATEKGHLGVIETLLKGQADVHCENKFERTPLDIAIINGRPDIVQTLQLAQHTAVGNLQEPTETVTVETSEVDGQDTIIDGSGGIPMDGHTVVTDAESGNIILNMRQIKTEPGTFDIKGESADESAEEEGNSTSVLATLAALAEATAQNTATSSNSTDAINWLESQGITMISTADGNIITSAVESGQTISLTEAGKIALNIIKQQGLATEDGVLSDVVEEDKDGTQKVITYVTADGSDLHQDTTGLHISSVTSVNPGEVAGGDIVINQLTQLEGGEEEDEDDGPDRKRARLTDEETTESTEIDVDSMLQKTGAGDATTIDSSDVEEMEREKLRKELEDIKRQAEEFKEQLKQKDRDLEEYKKQLGEISDKADDLKTS